MRYAMCLMLALGLVAGCGNTDESHQTDIGSAVGTMTSHQMVAKAATYVAGDFMKDMKGEMMKLMAQGPAEAITVCRDLAPEAAAEHASDSAWSMVRITDRPRNAAHLATPEQLEVLKQLADSATENEMNTVINSTGTEDDMVFHYYQPIYTMDMCLQCHGTPEKIDPAVAKVVQSEYPEDQATGYHANELRGALLITVKWPEGKAFAEEIIAAHESDKEAETY